MRRAIVGGIVVVLAMGATVCAGTVTITVGDHYLIPNTGMQEVPILVSGTDLAQGMTLRAQIGATGPQADPRDRPVFEEALAPVPPLLRPNFRPEMLGSTVWEPDHDDGTRVVVPPEHGGDHFYLGYLTIEEIPPEDPVPVLMDGTLVTLLVDTTDVPLGIYDLSLLDTADGPTELLGFAEVAKDVIVDIFDGTLTVTKPGDTDIDFDVDFADFNNLANNYTGDLAPGVGGKVWGQGDFDKDADVDFADFNALANNYTGALKGLSLGIVPEPTTLAMLLGLLGVVPLMRIWRRRKK